MTSSHRARASRRPRPSRRSTLLATGAVLTVGATVAAVVLAGWRSPASTNDCALGTRPLQVVAAPEIAPTIAEMVRLLSPRPGEGDDEPVCPDPVVRAEDPVRTAEAIATDAIDRPDVWVPDSSLWTGPLARSGGTLAGNNPSVASSPFVLATQESTGGSRRAAGLSVADLLPSAAGGSVRWSVPDLRRSSSSVGALLMAQRALRDRSDRAETLALLLRRAELGAAHDLEEAVAGGTDAPVVVPTTEQRATSYNARHRDRSLALVYPDDLTSAADYPYVVLAATRSRRLAAGDLLEELHGDLGRRLLAAAGFRDRFGVPGAALSAHAGVDSRNRPPRAPRTPAVRAIVAAVDAIRKPSHLLTVLDVSGSMAAVVPGAGGASRLDLAVQALVAGLATYPDDTVVGLWAFSTDLRPGQDHRVLVTPTVLGTGSDGSSGRGRLVDALGRVRVVPDGGTGLYDTVLASVRAARSSWDPDRANSVILVTDGADQDKRGIGLRALLRTLAAERDRSRPVSVFAVAYGPSADHRALRRIVRATGGAAYQALDYRDLPSVIADAIGRRGEQRQRR